MCKISSQTNQVDTINTSNTFVHSVRSHNTISVSNEPRGNVSVRTTDSKDHLEYFDADTKVLNERYFDIGFTNSPVQCDVNQPHLSAGKHFI
jgi:hypothetical protein